MINCWCGKSTRVAGLLVALIDLTVTLTHAGIGLVVIFCPGYFPEAIGLEKTFLFPVNVLPDADSYDMSLLMTGVIFATECALVTLLFLGILQRDPVKCDLWVKLRLVLLAVGTFGYVFEMSLVPLTSSWQVFIVIWNLILAVVYRAFSILIVRSLRTDILFSLNGYDLLGQGQPPLKPTKFLDNNI